ncbi:hypothetical protein F5Y15DRAFT_172850 [Xylariaceae sp. FL0016]|nr:hypothetical protein F5Y15DRAFT_172850 [Xylariaceae sp. FL0016]
MSCNDDREPPAHPTLPVKSDSAPKVKREGGSGIVQHSLSSRRTVCDLCRQRRIRCDGGFPCDKCVNATLKCKRDHVPKKRGPKRGHGRVINELRAREKASGETESANANTSARTSDVENDPLSSAPRSAFTTAPSSPQACFIPWLRRSSSDSHYAPESKSPFSTDAYRPTSASYFHLIPRCVDLYYDHMYPIMPILYMPSIRAMIEHPLTPAEKNLVYALCALTAFHMSGQSILAPGPPSWEVVGRFFLDECIAVRQTYDFLDDASLFAVISSFWISTSFFEINQNRKSWYYLREAMTLALELRLHVNATYIGLREEEVLCRQRVFWILFVTERSFAILRNKPLTLRKMPSLPTKGHSYEGPDIHAGFIKLVKSYIPLDESFVNAWNDPSDPSVSKNTYLTLQNTLAKSLDCLVPLGRRSRPSSLSGPVKMEEMEIDDDYSDERVPNEIQKADLLMTQQWLRLIVWQSSFRQGLLSKYARNECMTFAFPLSIARDAATVIQSLPSSAIEVHGMGIFEKIFDIGTWLLK